MTAIKDGRQPAPGRQRFHQQRMQIIIDDVARRLEIQRIHHLIIPIILVPVQILRLPAVARVVEEEGIVRLGVGDEPLHGGDHVGARGDLPRVARVVDEHDDVVLFVAEAVWRGQDGSVGVRGVCVMPCVPHKNLDMLVASLMHPFNSELVPL